MRLLAPKLLALHLLGVVATTAAVLLGWWQYDAWQAGRDLAARDLASAAPVPLDAVLPADAAFPGDSVGRPVSVAGRWDPDDTLLVADREGPDGSGRTGRWVVTPLAVCPREAGCAGAPAVLVVRGWVADQDAAPPPPEGHVELTGWLQPGEGSGGRDPDPADRVLPALRIPNAVQLVDRDLYGGYVVLDTVVSTSSTTGDGATTGDSSTTGLEPVTPAALPGPGSFASVRNLLYAVEWWVFGGFAVFLWWRWVRDELQPPDDPDDPDEAGEPDDAGPPDREHDTDAAGIASSP